MKGREGLDDHEAHDPRAGKKCKWVHGQFCAYLSLELRHYVSVQYPDFFPWAVNFCTLPNVVNFTTMNFHWRVGSSSEQKAPWWAYRIGRPPSSLSAHSSNIFSSDTTGPIKAKFHMEPPWDGGMKVCSNDPGHMMKIATMPIYARTLKIFFSGTKRLMTFKLGMKHQVL